MSKSSSDATGLMHPRCVGANPGMSNDTCPRCSCTASQLCGDDLAFDAQWKVWLEANAADGVKEENDVF